MLEAEAARGPAEQGGRGRGDFLAVRAKRPPTRLWTASRARSGRQWAVGCGTDAGAFFKSLMIKMLSFELDQRISVVCRQQAKHVTFSRAFNRFDLILCSFVARRTLEAKQRLSKTLEPFCYGTEGQSVSERSPLARYCGRWCALPAQQGRYMC